LFDVRVSEKMVSKPRSRRALFAGVFAGILAFIGLSLLAFARIEEHDPFCASCHTEPEVTYVNRAQAAGATDLASAHAMLHHADAQVSPTRCIDCHSGPGVGGRLESMALGARDAVRWVAGTAVQPAVQTVPIADANCLKCHTDIAISTDFDNHSHHYLAQWQALDAQAGTCVSCHSSHTTDGNARIGFLQQQRTQAQCDACHTAMQVR
jgi:hypothetical protein